jgi:hypothetical protein
MMSTIILVFLIAACTADVFMHNPRGSNDRNCERNENRNNGNRLFDSQNNDKGGYACPRAFPNELARTSTEMYYYTKSMLKIEWTHQHGCGTYTSCQIVIQYMCSAYYEKDGEEFSMYDPDHPYFDLLAHEIRDGMPPTDDDPATERMNAGQENLPKYGYHETSAYYQYCSTKMRNTGVWVADQNVHIEGPSTRTRQNPNGNRHGWECPEERDYYPYWGPSPWKDIAVLTSDESLCDMYQEESQNVKDRYWCKSLPSEEFPGGEFLRFNSLGACVAGNGQWIRVPNWGIKKPECIKAAVTRENNLGNMMESGETPYYMWEIPKSALNGKTDRCVLRLRYNISTSEVVWNYDARYNGMNSPIKQDPYATYAGYNLSLAVNTNQYGRTFQDRSYRFGIKKRPENVEDGMKYGAKLWNLNVRGKRGNIVQAYPAVEYDFTPVDLFVDQDDYVHFQWTGSDYNPNREPNNGEGGPNTGAGQYGADRHNIVPTPVSTFISGSSKKWFGVMDKEEMIALAYIGQNVENCMSYSDLLIENPNDQDQLRKSPYNCMKLNMARNPHFDLPQPVKMKEGGIYEYMSTRNSNFSNRNQKASITVKPRFTQGEVAGIVLGTFAMAGMVAGGGGYFYAKKHPNSRVAGYMSKLPFIN